MKTLITGFYSLFSVVATIQAFKSYKQIFSKNILMLLANIHIPSGYLISWFSLRVKLIYIF